MKMPNYTTTFTITELCVVFLSLCTWAGWLAIHIFKHTSLAKISKIRSATYLSRNLLWIYCLYTLAKTRE